MVVGGGGGGGGGFVMAVLMIFDITLPLRESNRNI
jgi:hypothetical protein